MATKKGNVRIRDQEDSTRPRRVPAQPEKAKRPQPLPEAATPPWLDAFLKDAFIPAPGFRAEERARRARAGDTLEARELLRQFAQRIRRSTVTVQRAGRTWTYPDPYALYVADALQLILDGKDAALALGIKTSNPGRRRGAVTHNPEALAAGFQLLVRRGLTKVNARSELQTETGADDKTIRHAIKDYECFSDPMFSSESIEVAARPLAEKISLILTRKGKK